jgi:hypothetical protein
LDGCPSKGGHRQLFVFVPIHPFYPKFEYFKAEQSFLFTRRILKSITLILCTTVFGWSLASSARLILPLLVLTDRENIFMANILGYATNLAAASTLPVLFFCRYFKFYGYFNGIFSAEYRKAMLAMFRLEKWNNVTPAVQTLTK